MNSLRVSVSPWFIKLLIMNVSSKLTSLGITLPPLAGPFGAYVPAKRAGNLIFVSGQLPMKDGKLIASGAIPSKCSIDNAKLAARQCVINALAAASTLPGGIDQLIGVVRVGAFVSSDASFTQQPQVANGASELLLELFGDAGKHIRAAVGVNVLPLDASVEIEFVFEC
jgi:enamine deaminase RidA (YjgF/YER057c/UK114 family)